MRNVNIGIDYDAGNPINTKITEPHVQMRLCLAGHKCPYIDLAVMHLLPTMISAPFHWHNFLSISRIFNLFSSKNTLRLYLGANTM